MKKLLRGSAAFLYIVSLIVSVFQYRYIPGTVQANENSEEYTELTQMDFGCVSEYQDASGTLKSSPYTNLDGTSFQVDIVFPKTSNTNYFTYPSTANWQGLRFYADRNNTDNLILYDAIHDVKICEFTPKIAGTTLVGTEVNMKITIDYIGDDVSLGVWFKDVLYNGKKIIVENCSASLGQSFLAYSSDVTTPYMMRVPEKQMKAPTDLVDITLSEFGVPDTKVAVESQQDLLLDNQLQGTLADTLFSAKITFQNGTYFAYASKGSVASYWDGLQFLATNGNLQCTFVSSELNAVLDTFEAEKADCTLVGEELLLQISLEAIDVNGDGAKHEARLGFFFNGKLYGYYYTAANGSLLSIDYLGTMIGLHPQNKGMSYASIGHTPINSFAEVSPSEFGIRDGDYANVTKTIADTLHQKKITVITAFSGVGAGILVGGDVLHLASEEYFEFAGNRILISKTGLSSVTDRFELGISLEYVDRDKDNLQDDLKCSFWFDGKQYRHMYFYVLDGVKSTGDVFGVSCENGTFVTLVSAKTELCNLANGPYLISGKGTITVNGEMVASGSLLKIPGDYVIVCTGEGEYRKKVALYRSGEAHPDNVYDVRDLVAIKKMEQGSELSSTSGRLGSDVDRDGVVELDDFDQIRRQLLGQSIIVPAKDKGIFYEEGVMPIGGFYGPYRGTDSRGTSYDYLDADIFKKIKDAGINLITYTENNYFTAEQRQDVLDGLELAKRYGIDVYVHDSRIEATNTDATLGLYLSDFAAYRSFKGIAVVDEPFTSYYGASYYEQGKNRLENAAPRATRLNGFSNLIGNVNLNPMYAGLGGEDYKTAYDKYLEEYITTCNARQISFDYYVFDTQGYATVHGTKGYFDNLSIVREKALKYNIPFQTYIQAGANWNGSTTAGMQATQNNVPTKGQLLWNVNTALAYGTKSIQYFPLIQPNYYAYVSDGSYDYARNGLLGADGEKTLWYGYAKEANEQRAAVDKVLLYATSKAVLAQGTQAQMDTGVTISTYDILETINVDNSMLGAVVGVFAYGEKTAFYVVNYDTVNSQKVELHFVGEQKYSVIAANKNEQTTSELCELELAAGSAVLVVVE